jgi:hypothetical protein
VRVGKGDQHGSDDHVHGRTRERNEEFLPRLFRNTLKLRDTANGLDRSKSDVLGVGC